MKSGGLAEYVSILESGDDALLASSWFGALPLDNGMQASGLAYGEFSAQPGFQIMDSPTEHWVERLTGLGATGVEAVIVYANGEPVQGHPLVPVLQMTTVDASSSGWAGDLDLILAPPSAAWPSEIAKLLHATLSGKYAPVNTREGNVDFQITRGRMGISL